MTKYNNRDEDDRCGYFHTPALIYPHEIFRVGGSGGWNLFKLLLRERNVLWKLSDMNGEMIIMNTYRNYVANLEGIMDDSPLAMYDALFEDKDTTTFDMTREYYIPRQFIHGLF